MLKMVDGTGIIGVDMICPLGISTPQPPNYDRVEMEGTGMLVLPNSLDAPLERLELGGKTEQVTTRGVNLFDASLAKSKENYKDVTINGAIIRAIELDLKPNTKYAFQCVIRSVSTTMNVGNSTIRYVVSDGQKRVITTNEDGKLYVGFTGNVDSEIGKIGVSIVDIQVEEGDTQTAYEPYTGGKPSPSPEYPQEIKNSGKWNEEKQKYEVSVKVTGKNLLNLQKEPDVKGLYQGWKVGNGDKGTLSIKDKGNNADISGCYFGLNSDGTTSNSVTWLVYNGVIKRYHIESVEKMYACLYPPKETFIKKITERFEIQYEYGSIATEYQPYKEQTLTLTSDRPITKWDRLVEQGGQIGWLYKSKIESIPKTGWVLHAQGYFYRGGLFLDSVVNNVPKNEVNLFTHFRLGNPIIAENKDVAWLCVVALGNTSLRVRLADETITTASAFEKYIADKDIKILYETEATEFVPLPQSEQNAIRALKTYYPTTVITADGGELYPDIKVTYRKEI